MSIKRKIPHKSEGRKEFLPLSSIKDRQNDKRIRQKDGEKNVSKIDNILTNKKVFH